MSEQDSQHKKSKASFVLYDDALYEDIQILSREERGDLLTGILEYRRTGKIIECDRVIKIALNHVINGMKISDEKYADKCKKNQENANKRWQEQHNANASNGNAKHANASNGINQNAKHAYTDTDTDTDTDPQSVPDPFPYTEKKEYIRKKIIERAMIKSFYKSNWNFVPTDVKEQDYKLGVYDAMTDWIIHNKKEDDSDFLDSTLVIVRDIYTQTNNNPEAIANIRECIAANKPILLPDSMMASFKKIKELNTPLSREDSDKKFKELKAKLRNKDGK
jgi:hypothetical protein